MKKRLFLVTGSDGYNRRKALKMLLREGYSVRATNHELGEMSADRSCCDSLDVESVPSGLVKPRLWDWRWTV